MSEREWWKKEHDNAVGCLGGVGMLAIAVALLFPYVSQWWSRPDDRCYWMVEQATPHADPCLVDVPTPASPDKNCMRPADVQGRFVVCDERRTLADFASKAGRRICGQKGYVCEPRK